MTVFIENRHIQKEVQKNAIEMGYVQGRYNGKPGDKQRSPVGYYQSLYGYAAGEYFHLSFDPCSPYRASAVLTIHLSKFSTLEIARSWLTQLCGSVADEVFNSKIHRIDMCVDVALPFDTIRCGISQPKVSKGIERSSRTGEKSLYIGSQPRLTIAYEKKVPVATIDWKPTASKLDVDRYGFTQAVRVEVRTWKDRCPIQSFNEIRKLTNYNPFSRLKITGVHEALLSEVSEKKKHVIDAYRWSCHLYGAQEAKERFSRQGNFKRMIGDFLRPLDLDLNIAWLNRTTRFFDEAGKLNCPLNPKKGENL